MTIRQNILGYHCNDKERCQKFVDCIDYLITFDDTDWLGQGMYFWDNLSNANYWLHQKIKKNPMKPYKIVCANLYLDKMLDLTDTNTLKTLNNLWNEYAKSEGTIETKLLGQQLDILFDYFDLVQDYVVIKVYGHYPHTPKITNNFFYVDFYNKRSIPSYNGKIIYNVKDSNFAVNRISIGGNNK